MARRPPQPLEMRYTADGVVVLYMYGAFDGVIPDTMGQVEDGSGSGLI